MQKERDLMMINKIGKVTVYVNDQQQAKDFWINKIDDIKYVV